MQPANIMHNYIKGQHMGGSLTVFLTALAADTGNFQKRKVTERSARANFLSCDYMYIPASSKALAGTALSAVQFTKNVRE